MCFSLSPVPLLLEGQIQETIPKRDHLCSFLGFVALNLLFLPHIIFSFAARLSGTPSCSGVKRQAPS